MNDRVKLIAAVVMLLIAAGLFVFHQRRSAPPVVIDTVICVDPKCAHQWQSTREEWMDSNIDNPAGPIGTSRCPKCGKWTGVIAVKCDGCGTFFVQSAPFPGMLEPRPCPACGKGGGTAPRPM